MLAARAGVPGLRAGGQAATLPGWRVVARRGSVYPTLVRGAGAAPGIIADLGAAAVGRLRRYEGEEYRLRRVTVRAAGRSQPAFAWIAPDGTDRPWVGPRTGA